MSKIEAVSDRIRNKNLVYLSLNSVFCPLPHECSLNKHEGKGVLIAKWFIIIIHVTLFKGICIYELLSKTMVDVHDGLK